MEIQSNPAGVPLDESSRARLVARHAQSIRQIHKQNVADIIEIGRRLSECRSLIRHGDWLPWLRREFSWSERTARNYIRAYETLAEKSANVADLSMQLSSVYLITAPSTPPEASVEVIGRVGAGEVVSRSEVKRIVDDAKHLRRPPTSVKEVFERTGAIVLKKLSDVERALRGGRSL